MKLLLYISLLLGCLNVSAQHFAEIDFVDPEDTITGIKTLSLLTEEGYYKILEPVSIGDLGELATQLLALRSAYVDLEARVSRIELLIPSIESQDKEVISTDMIVKIIDDISIPLAVSTIVGKYKEKDLLLFGEFYHIDVNEDMTKPVIVKALIEWIQTLDN